MSPSIAASILDGLAYLTGYPYGCVEQTMSKALPNAVVGRAINVLGVDNPQLKADLPRKVSAGLQRLYGYQHNDGGWGWWFDDSSDDYQTAYVLFGLAMTKQAGYEVDQSVIDRGAKYMTERLPSVGDDRTKAYALFALAQSGKGDLAEARRLATFSLQAVTETQRLDAFSGNGAGDQGQLIQAILLGAKKAGQQKGDEEPAGIFKQRAYCSNAAALGRVQHIAFKGRRRNGIGRVYIHRLPNGGFVDDMRF